MWYKVGSLATVLLIYFFAIRPARTFVVSSFLLPTTQSIQSPSISVQPYHGVGLLIIKNGEYLTEYKITGGLFFLISGLAIAVSKHRNKLLKWLIMMHGIGFLLTLLVLYSGIALWPKILPVMLIITKYIVPAFSLSLVPLAISDKFAAVK